MHTFPDAPEQLFDERGVLRFGSYRGALRDIDYRGKISQLRRLQREKRWLWLMLLKEPWLLTLAVVRTGYSSNSFLLLQHLERQSPELDSSALGLPLAARVRRRAHDTLARFGALPGAGLCLQLCGDRGTLRGDKHGISLQLQLLRSQSFSAIAKVPGELGSCTEKGIGEVPSGELRWRDARVDLRGALWGYDLTCGLLAHETRWRWAFGLARDERGKPIGFNLTEGFVDQAECVRFDADHGPQPLGAVRFAFERTRLREPWRVRGERGLDLQALPLSFHHEKRDFGPISADFLQAPARFNGQLPGCETRQFVGVVEDQFVRW